MHQTVSAPYYTENASLHLGINGLVTGIFDEFDIDKTVNNICSKTAANVKAYKASSNSAPNKADSQGNYFQLYGP